LILVAVATGLPALHGTPIWDDSYVFTYPLLHGDGALGRIWLTTQPLDFWPLTLTSFWGEWQLFGTWYAGYHAVNLALHALNAVLLWRLLLALEVPGAYLAGVLFAVHPVNVEAVAWMFQLKTLQATALCLGSWLAFHRRRLALAWLLFAGALLSKTSVVMLPVVLLAYAWTRRASARLLVPYFALAAGLGSVALWFQRHRVIGGDVVRDDSLPARLATAGRAVWFYVQKALVPWPLSFVYPRWSLDATAVVAFLPLGALVVAGGALVLIRRPWARAVAAGMAVFVVTLVPVLGFVNVYFMRYSLVADHWQYQSIGAVMALVAAGLVRLGRPGRAAAVVLATVLGLLAWQRSQVFASAEAVWTDTIAKNPAAWLAYDNLAVLRAAEGRFVETIALEREAVRLEPRSPEAHCNLGLALMERGDIAEAANQLETAVRLRPDRPHSVSSLALVYNRQGRANEAVEAARAAVRMAPGELNYRLNLGLILADAGRYAEARSTLEDCQRLNPDDPTIAKSLGRVLVLLGARDEALRQFSRAVAAAPGDAEARTLYDAARQDWATRHR
jgi:Flp pilus assembly protein TadD